jgi:hypothetical protein
MQCFSVFLFSYKIISRVTISDTKACVAVVFYMHVYSNVAAPDFHVVLSFTSAVDEHNAVRYTHTLLNMYRILFRFIVNTNH